jgi:ABC-type transport system substrate-binding protein/DNA-binding SARP family transcriptional activator/streptogramin lyase
VGGDGIQFRILGPLEVLVDDAPLRIGGPRQRALLALLLLSANQVVSRDRLIEELFGSGQTGSADHALRVQVSRLRKALGGTGEQRLLASPPGYLLRVEPREFDLHAFERLFAEGRRALDEGNVEKSAAELRAAEKLWRGRPLADLEFEPFARVEVERLEELRLAAVEARIDAELTLGRDPELVPELEALVAEHPLREGLRSQLMLALYRCGRQADALETYRVGRSLLSEELALEPSPRLRELEQAILRQEPTLALTVGEPRAVATKMAAPPREPRTDAGTRGWRAPGARGRRYMVFGALIAAALGATAFAAVRFTSDAPTLLATANSVGVIDSRGDTIRSVVDTRGQPRGIAAGAGATWVTDAAGDFLLRIDRKGAVERIPVGHGPTGVAVGDGEVWVVNQLDRTVAEINPTALKQVATIAVGNGPSAIAFGAGSVWVANSTDNTLARIDPAAGAVVATIGLGAGVPEGVAAGKNRVWVTSSTGHLLLVDPRSNRVSLSYPIGNGPKGVAIGNGSVWVANSEEGTVSRFDPGTGSGSKIPVGRSPSGVAFGAGAVWVANGLDGTVSRIDPRTSSVQQIRVGNEPFAVAADSKNTWVTVLPSPASHRGGTLRIAGGPSARTGLRSIDPAVFDGIGQWLMLSVTSDGLVSYRRVGGLLGDTLVADLATSLPEPTDRGRTYTFQVRSGIRYSNGQLVKPSDFRRAIERAFVVGNAVGNDYPQSFYTGIVGAPRCAEKPRHCSLRRGVETDDGAGTVTFHLRSADPEFLYKLAFAMAAAVPAGTPDRDIGRKPLPATGPYMTRSFRPGRSWVMVRNPRFHEWSADAQPAGYPDRIVMSMNSNQDRAVRAIERGTTDVLLFPPSNRVTELATRYTSQLHSDPSAATFALAMNTRVPPFDRLAVRRALNYALDRNRIVGFSGGRLAAQATCQTLPPNLFGYRPYCPYTLDPGRDVSWAAPDLATAEQLVRSTGTRGMRVTVLVAPDPMAPSEKIGAYTVSVLRRLGYRASLKVLDSISPGPLGNSRARPQIGWFTWYQDFPAPSNFIEPLLSCRSFAPGDPGQLNFAEFCDPTIDAHIRHAEALQTRDQTSAGEAWARIDHELVDRAPWVPLYNPRALTALSARVGNYQYHPFWQVLLDQLWVR